MQLAAVADRNLISPSRLADSLRTTQREIGQTIGVAPESLSRKSRVGSVAVQTKLRHLVEVLNAVTPMTGSAIMAYAWFRSEPLAGFGGRTPEQVVKDGEGEGLRAHIQRRLEGGYA